MKKQNFSVFQLILLFLGGLVLLFILAPLAAMFFSSDLFLVGAVIREKKVADSIFLTLWTSMLATVLLAIGSIPLAYILARKRFKLRGLVLGIINLPVVIPHTAAGIALLGLISRDSLPGKIANAAGLDLLGNPFSIVLAMAFVSVPFLINAAIEAFASVPERYEKTALNLGASPFKVFFLISLPMAWRGIVSGSIMMWARGMSEFGAVVIVAYHPMITPVLIYERFASFGLSYATPVAIAFVLITLVFFIAMRLLSESNLKSRK